MLQLLPTVNGKYWTGIAIYHYLILPNRFDEQVRVVEISSSDRSILQAWPQWRSLHCKPCIPSENASELGPLKTSLRRFFLDDHKALTDNLRDSNENPPMRPFPRLATTALSVSLCSVGAQRCSAQAFKPDTETRLQLIQQRSELQMYQYKYEQAQWDKKWKSYEQPSSQGFRRPQSVESVPRVGTAPDQTTAGREYSDVLLEKSATQVTTKANSPTPGLPTDTVVPSEELSPSPSLRRMKIDAAASEQAQIALKYFNGEGLPRNEERGFAQAKKAAENGDSYAALLLGLAYRDGIGVTRSPEKSFPWIELAARKDLPTAQVLLAEDYLFGAGTARNPTLALGYFQKAAQAGDPLAQLRAAQMFYLGAGTTRDTAKALDYAESARATLPEADYYVALILHGKPDLSKRDFELIASSFRRAGEAGHPLAGLMYGVCLHSGVGVAKDYVAAIPWIRSGAEQGVPFAIELLGEIYDFGDGVQADPAQAKKFYERAAQLLDTNAMVLLGNMYAAGRGVTANPSTAVSWYRLAVGAGNGAGGAAGALNLGTAYLYGKGVTKDVQEGMKWVLKAADSNRMAQYFLGLYYTNGDFVPKDDVQAAFWWSKAAAQGHADSQFFLARAYEYAKGVQLDWGKAFYWYSRAAENGVPEASGSVCEFYRLTTEGVDWRSPEATSVLQVGADRKQPSCLYLQALRFVNGIQGPQDPVRAVELLRLAAQSNYNRAEFDLANAYWKGIGVQPDKTQFRYWLERAADHGNTSAIQLLKEAGLR